MYATLITLKSQHSDVAVNFEEKFYIKDYRLSYSSFLCFWFLFIDFHSNLCNLFSFSYFVFNLLSFFPRILKLKFWSFGVIDLSFFLVVSSLICIEF